MSILSVFLQNERGEVRATVDHIRILDARDNPVIPRGPEEQFLYLRYIDRYGDTVFNKYQMIPFIDEWDRLSERASTPEQIEKLAEVRALAVQCREGRHLYLKFQGD